MNTPTTVAELLDLYERRGGEHYGEGVSQRDHGLQCAARARDDAATPELIAAALLHDVGHLIVDTQANNDFDLAINDDHHDAVGGRCLAAIFGPRVSQPVALHVTAKRWLCTVDRTYLARLSAASQQTFRAQGGALDDAARQRFEAHPGFDDALRVRRWDDDAKVSGAPVREFADYREMLDALVLRAS